MQRKSANHETCQACSEGIELKLKIWLTHAFTTTPMRRHIECVKVPYLSRINEKKIIERNNLCSRCNKFSCWKPDQCARHYQSEMQCCTANLHKIQPSKWFHLILSFFQTIHICCIVTWCQMQLYQICISVKLE